MLTLSDLSGGESNVPAPFYYNPPGSYIAVNQCEGRQNINIGNFVKADRRSRYHFVFEDHPWFNVLKGLAGLMGASGTGRSSYPPCITVVMTGREFIALVSATEGIEPPDAV